MKYKKNVLVVGGARSGLGAAKLAHAIGHTVTLYDSKALEVFDQAVQEDLMALKKIGITLCLNEECMVEQYDLVVVSPGVPLDIPIIETAYLKEKEVIGEVEFAVQSNKAPLVAITGTNGKTTTTALVGQIIKAYNQNTYIVGNIGRAFSEDVLEIPEEGVVVAEVSSFQLETTKTFHPTVAAILNITPDHLNRHKTMTNYAMAKYQVTARQTQKDWLVINQDDSYYEEIKAFTKAQVVSFSSTKEVAYGTYFKEGILYENMSGEAKKVCKAEDLKILGIHNVENALASIAICKAMGIPDEIIVKELLAFKGVEHRIEFVDTIKGIDCYNDSKATNVDAAIRGLLSMNKPVRLIAGGMDKDSTFEAWIKYFGECVSKAYLIGETKQQIKSECLKVGFDQVELVETLEEAVNKAYAEANESECILLSPACASWDMFKSFEQRGDLFKQIVNELEV